LKNRRSPAFLLGFFLFQIAKFKEQRAKFKAKRSKIVSPVEPLAQSIEHKAQRIKMASPAAQSSLRDLVTTESFSHCFAIWSLKFAP
jgi:hypothetical protein